MFREYAVDPAVLSSWDRVRYFLDAFGPWRGRFLAEYPRGWKRMVFDGLRCPDLEKKRIVERLTQLDRRCISPRRTTSYVGTKPWLENALVEHAQTPFHAIISSSASSDSVLDANDVDDRCERWRVETGAIVPRDPRSFVLALGLLLRASARVIVIDPYFRADQSDKTLPLAAFCKTVLPAAATVEVHFGDELSYAHGMLLADRALPFALPMGARVTLRCWKTRPGGPRLHNRYILTDIGGVQFGDGIEMGHVGHQDRISILDETSWLALWEQYASNFPAFDESGPAREFVGRSPV